MKFLYCLFFYWGLTLSSFAQSHIDAIRFSQTFPGSSAKSFSMGGAMGAVGADISNLVSNPAGLALQRKFEYNFGFGFNDVKNNSSFISSEFSDNKFSMNLPSLGFIAPKFHYDSGFERKKGWVNVNYAFGLNRNNSFHNRFFFNGVNLKNSITDYFAEAAKGSNPNNLTKTTRHGLAYRTYLIDDDGSGNYYSSIVSPLTDVTQNGIVESRGAINDYSFAIAGNFSNKFYLGGGVFLSHVRYIEEFSYFESDNSEDSVRDFNSLDFLQNLKTSGIGVGARIGFLTRLGDYLKIGARLETPVKYFLKDVYSYSMTALFDQGATDFFNSPKPVFSEDESGSLFFNYNVTTPVKYGINVALQIEKFAMLSADLEMVDYAQSKMSSQFDPFTTDNKMIKTIYSDVVNVRLGAEFSFGVKKLRFGYANYPSTFRSNALPYNEKLSTSMLTIGYGIREKDYYMDFALGRIRSASFFTPYTLNNTDVYTVTNNIRSVNVMVTFGFFITD